MLLGMVVWRRGGIVYSVISFIGVRGGLVLCGLGLRMR